MKTPIQVIFILVFTALQFTTSAQKYFKAWSVLAGGEAYDYAYDFVELPNAGFVIVGATNSSLSAFSSNHGAADIMVAAYNANGQQQWMKLLGGSQNDVGSSIVRNSDGTFYIAGRTKSSDFDFTSNVGLYDYFLMKLAADGTKQWSKTYGGSDNDVVSNLIVLNDGLLLSGVSASNDSLAGPTAYGYTDNWFVKTDTAGNVVWRKKTGGSDSEYNPMSKLMSNGKIYSLGSTASFDYDVTTNSGPDDLWLNQLNPFNGSLTAEFSCGGPMFEIAAGIAEDNAGNYYVCGSTGSTVGINAVNHGAFDYYVTKYTAAGVRLWSKCYGGFFGDFLHDVTYKNNALYLCGTSTSNDGDIINYYGAEDVWVLKIDTAGTIQNNFSFGREYTDEGYKVLVTQNDELIVLANTTSGNLDNTPTAGLNDILLLKMGYSPAGIDASNAEQVTLLPNPSRGIFNLQNWQQQMYIVTDISGKTILESSSATIDISTFQAGIYFFSSGVMRTKLIKTD